MIALLPVLGFLRSAAANWRAILAVCTAAVLGLLLVSWDHRGKQIIIEKQHVAQLEANAKVLEHQIELVKEATRRVEVRAEHRSTETVAVTRIEEKANAVSAKKDGPIAPVLRGALDDIARLRLTATTNP